MTKVSLPARLPLRQKTAYLGNPFSCAGKLSALLARHRVDVGTRGKSDQSGHRPYNADAPHRTAAVSPVLIH